jgi:membrane-associated phospholipid phosphatase
VQFLTDFADQRVALPFSLVVAIAFALSGWKRGALAWTGVAAAALGCLAVMKIVFLACGWRWTNGELNSPSGHTACAALMYGGFALLMLRRQGVARHARLLIPPLLAALIGFSRLSLHYHSLAEVIAGGAVGVAGAFLMPVLAGPPPPFLPIRRVLAPAVLVLVLLHGGRLQAEGLLRRFTIDGLWPPASCRMPDSSATPPADPPRGGQNLRSKTFTTSPG